MREIGRHHHPGTHRFAMQPLAIAEPGFNRMAEGMTEIQDRPQPALALVALDHRGLDLARARHSIDQRARIAGPQGRHVTLDRIEVGSIGNRPMLDHFGQPGRQLALGQGHQGIDIDQHQPRLVKGADHVLAKRMIDAGLAPNRRIDLRQQGGWHLHKIDATLIDRRRKTRHVADHAAADRHQQRPAIEARLEQRIEDQVERVEGLVGLAGRHDHFDERRRMRREQLPDRGPMQRRDVGVGHDRHLPPGGQSLQRLAVGQQAAADQDRIGALAERNIQFNHRWGDSQQGWHQQDEPG